MKPVLRIACLHTAESNIALFDAAAAALPVELTHTVRADLYQRALAMGGADTALLAETAAVLSGLSGDVRIMNCTTLCPAADGGDAIRVDEALAAQAVNAARGAGRSVEAFVTTPTTVASTAAVFHRFGDAAGVRIRITLIEDALPAFLAGDLEGYARRIAAVAERSDADVIALAQTSMAPAALHMTRPALGSPAAALMKAVELGERLRLS